MSQTVTILGAGLAGSEAALWLADHGFSVELIEQKPEHYTVAHKRAGFAELICSNSLKSDRLDSASGLLKAEMRRLGSNLLKAADQSRVAAGGALAVDRDQFSDLVTKQIQSCAGIHVKTQRADELPENRPLLIASGPLTDGKLADNIAQTIGGDSLSFFDAVAPIVTAESIDRSKVFAASRYGKGEADYLNCPFNKEQYELFYQELSGAQRAPLHDGVENVSVYEGCMPIEIMASRGADTMRYGPLRPVGLIDPATGHRPWANVQLRSENKENSLYNLVGFQTNLKWGEQKRVFQMIPGLENAEFVRYGVMHRNTFINSPKLLNSSLALKTQKEIHFAGQITGFEGYMESAACGMLAAVAIACELKGCEFVPPPPTTMCGALLQYITSPNADFQPMGANMGILPPLEEKIKDKRLRYAAVSQRALADFEAWIDALPVI